jgi:ADP-heptose:LPS heptosyltransferase
MHLAIVTEPIETPVKGPGTYLANDATAAKMLAYNPGKVTLKDAPFFDKELRRLEDYDGKRVLVCQMGAGGDLLMLTPALRELAADGAMIDVACFPSFAPLLQNLPFIREVIDNPVEADLLGTYDAVVWLDDKHGAEHRDTEKALHPVSIAFIRMGLWQGAPSSEQLKTDFTLSYVVTDEEKAAALARFPRGSRRRIGIQLTASEPARSWPEGNTLAFTKLAIEKGYDVYLFGWPGQTGQGKTSPPAHLFDLTRCDPPLGLREAAAVLSTMDGVVAPDSLWFHAASALKVPLVGLFGAFPGELRKTSERSFVINGPSARRLDGEKCNPCFHHSGSPGQHQFPVDGPCAVCGYCLVLSAIAPDRVLAVLEKEMGKRQESG